MTMEERLGELKGKTLAFVGDTHNNVSNSLMAMSAKMGVNFIACGPEHLKPADEVIDACRPIAEANGCKIVITSDMAELSQADVIYTDVWLSMGEAKEKWGERIELLRPYQVNAEMIAKCAPNVKFMHCLPATRGEEVTDEVMDSDYSVCWDEAENRLTAMRALLVYFMGKMDETIAVCNKNLGR